MNDNITTILELKEIMSKVVSDRDWQQFHTPSNLAKSIVIEAAELLEKFQWADGDKSKEILEKERQEVEHEVSDIFAYLLSLCQQFPLI